jgi:hypothetical protein
MKKAISAEAVKGLPKLKIDVDNICGECQIGKQTRMSHPNLQHQVTYRALELLHMDLMGPMQVESREEKGMLMLWLMTLQGSLGLILSKRNQIPLIFSKAYAINFRERRIVLL